MQRPLLDQEITVLISNPDMDHRIKFTGCQFCAPSNDPACANTEFINDIT
jgi:hypothetical protein